MEKEEKQVCGNCNSFLKSERDKGFGKCGRMPSRFYGTYLERTDNHVVTRILRNMEVCELKVSKLDSCMCWEPRKEQE